MTTRATTAMAENGAPPQEPATLYAGTVMHARMKPVAHRFSYKVFSLLLDLDRLDEAEAGCALFSVGRFNLAGFDPRDHGPRDGTPLRAHVDALLRKAGLARAARVLLLAYPRILGYVFNPLSVYYAYDDAGTLTAVVYEVRNTFGDLHTYVAPVRVGQLSAAGLRQEQDKTFHVSPFLDMDQRYRFRLLPPGRSLRIRILECDADGPVLAATFQGTARPMTDAALAAACARVPLLTLKVIAGIHWQAFKLWLKGVRFYPRPIGGGKPGAPATARDDALAGTPGASYGHGKV
ncbi:DUF1365 domain-containing protein [Polymorphum gilvum]|uniref:Hypothetical conserved protein n=1 Tax=Polymorphum gilvum (strain LMG 25793 / CGMCC 1.9160 / SL003B-26A1) TaxID=991905 RepID=F2IXC6_POLGS|nr:DUF1365 domain-containing protein [Polymorphum gilvum]ADZ70444.1 Hypothetical conserved protein [Polymorphum gilvum SL003B-26A1]